FTVSLYEYPATIPTLWDAVKEFITIANLNLWRSEAYLKFFDFLDKKGGFFYERWGDAPVHSIAAALFLKKHQVHFFNEIGYKHDPFIHCPTEENLRLKCHCDPDLEPYSCTG
ncbi:11873_t:CDS:2, partial [Scutellospora calospora]